MIYKTLHRKPKIGQKRRGHSYALKRLVVHTEKAIKNGQSRRNWQHWVHKTQDANFSFGHCIVCLSLIDYFWVLHWHLQTFLLVIVLSVFRWLTTSEYSFDIFKLFFWSLYCMSFVDWLLLSTPLTSSNFSFGHCIVLRHESSYRPTNACLNLRDIETEKD
jgi:hypothetical protein